VMMLARILIWVSIASRISAKPASRIDASFSWWWAIRWWQDSNRMCQWYRWTTVFRSRFWLAVIDMLVPFTCLWPCPHVKGKWVKPRETIESLRYNSIAFADALDSKSCAYFPYKYSMSQWTRQWWLLFNCTSHSSWSTDVSMENHLSYAQWGSNIRMWCCIQLSNPAMDFVPISSLLCSLVTQAVSKGCRSLSSSFIEQRLWIWCD
jgi:hypothetical protein